MLCEERGGLLLPYGQQGGCPAQQVAHQAVVADEVEDRGVAQLQVDGEGQIGTTLGEGEEGGEGKKGGEGGVDK